MPNVPKPKAPACTDCNQRLKLVEERVFFPLALALDPEDQPSKGLRDLAERAIDPNMAKNETDRAARQKRREWLAGLTFVPSSSDGALPGFAPSYSGQSVARVKETDLHCVAEKIFRIVFWSAYQSYVEPPYHVGVHVVRKSEEVDCVEAVIKAGDKIAVPPGVVVYLRRADDDPKSGLVVVELWGRLRLFGSIVPIE